MTNKNLLKEVEKDKEKKVWKEKITKIKKDVMNILKKSKSMKSFYSKTKRSLDSLEKLDKEHRYKLGISIQNWVIFHKPKWEKNLIKYPKPNPKKKYSLSDYVYWEKFNDERLKHNLNSKQEFKIFLENDFLLKYYGLSKFYHFGVKDDFLDDFIVDLKSTSFYKRFNLIVFFIVKYFEESKDILDSTIKNLKEDRIYLYEYMETRKNQIQNLNFDSKKQIFTFEKELVMENYRLFPILFFFMDFIKEDILRDKLGYSSKKIIPNSEVFRYISDLIIKSRSYLNDTPEEKKSLENRVRQRYKEFQQIYEQK